MAAGGTGKTIFACGVAADVSTGRALPGAEDSDCEAQNVLIISAEDSGEILKARLRACGANLSRVFILDRVSSAGLNLAEEYEAFEHTVLFHHPRLVIIDPWHAFLGADLNINRVNAIRPILQKLSNLSQKCNCSMLLISHVNKKVQAENANNAATGSVDFVNAARSALMVVFDEDSEDMRVVVHTKSNYAAYGPSIRYRITDDGGLEWAGFSDITRQTLEAAARRRSTPAEVAKLEQRKYQDSPIVQAIRTLLEQSADGRWEGTMSDLMTEGTKIAHQSLANSTRALSSAISRLDNSLYNDGILHERIPHGTGGGRHRFRMVGLDGVLKMDSKLLSIPF